jgi:CHAD domain-containing protein
VKARKVKGLDPDGALMDNLRRIVESRLDEVHSFSEAASDPKAVTTLHNMRIAAKRLRYVLELTEPVLGPAASEGAREAKALQTLLGEIHDCDVMLPRIEAHARRLGSEDATAVRQGARRQAKDLEPGLAREAPNRKRYRGLASLATYTRARRALLYERFVKKWSALEKAQFREKVMSGFEPKVG